jgi:molecular chaperone GrpE
MFWKKKDNSMQNLNNEDIKSNEVEGSSSPLPNQTEELTEVKNETEINSAPEVQVVQTPEELMKAEIEQLNDKYIRLFAEFDNYKRRTAKERLELFSMANRETILALLPVLDDFERAMKAFQNTAEAASLKEGVELIYTKFNQIMQSKGVKPMESIGQPFNIDFHEAITNISAPSEDMKGKVIDEVEKGYFLNDKVVRFAKVVVGE